MRYIVSDIHGCYEEYRKLLELIHFSDQDLLYVLGDCADRGPEPIRVLQDMMMRPNVIFLIGNHDYMMLKVLKRLSVTIDETNWSDYLTAEDMLDYTYWMRDGGETTSRQYSGLPHEEQQELLEYLEEGLLYDTISWKGRTYVLAHAGIHGFSERKPLEEYDFTDFLFYPADYGRRYFREPGHFLVTGHMPTMHIRPDKQPLIYEGNGHIALDCGCVFGGNLAAYCVETGEAFYVEGRKRR